MHVQIEPNQVYFDEISYHNISIFLWNLFYGVALELIYELFFFAVLGGFVDKACVWCGLWSQRVSLYDFHGKLSFIDFTKDNSLK